MNIIILYISVNLHLHAHISNFQKQQIKFGVQDLFRHQPVIELRCIYKREMSKWSRGKSLQWLLLGGARQNESAAYVNM